MNTLGGKQAASLELAGIGILIKELWNEEGLDLGKSTNLGTFSSERAGRAQRNKAAAINRELKKLLMGTSPASRSAG
jgi:hypothetical protein